MEKKTVFFKPVILVSRCLGFERCRYNGDIINDPVVKKLKDHVNFITVCPEVEIGLGIPRNPIRIIRRDNSRELYQPATKLDVTERMITFSETFIKNLPNIDGAILKYRSPSCGPSNVKIYTGYDPGSKTEKGSGFFAGKLIQRYEDIPIEDEGRLYNFTIRENFYTRIFLIARFNNISKIKSIKELIDFHSDNKYLFMAINQSGLRKMGKTIAGYNKENVNEIFTEYKNIFFKALKNQPSTGSWINVISHLYGGINEKLSKEERVFFLNSVEEYRDERIPLSVILKLIKSWAVRFNETYLLRQSLLEPFPPELTDIRDSGKGRNY